MPFQEEMIIVDSNQKAEIENDSGDRVGELGGGGTLNYFYRLNFSEHKNWDESYDEIVIDIKTSEEIHEPVYMYVINGSNLKDDGSYGNDEEDNIVGEYDKKPNNSWKILDKDEYSTDGEFITKTFSIKDLGLTDVSQITIYTEDSFTFRIDDLEVRRTNIVSEFGKIRFQYSTEASVNFHSVFFNTDVPAGTAISVRLKVAPTVDSLLTAFYTMPLNSGEVVAIDGAAAEVEVTMSSDDTRELTPILRSIELRLLTDADFTGFLIDEESEWLKGTLNNVDINPSEVVGKSVLNISDPINVGGRYYSKAGSIGENSSDDNAVYGFSGSGKSPSFMPIAPNQAINWGSESGRGFGAVPSVVRRFDNTFLVADMDNNRIIKVDRDGTFIKGIGSTFVTDNKFYLLSAVYNSSESILSLAFTGQATVADITKIYFKLGSSQISLSSEDTVLNNRAKKSQDNKIVEIKLGDDTAVRLLNANTENLFVNFDLLQAFTTPIEYEEGNGMIVEGNAIYSAAQGLTCFVGDFSFVDNIRRPVFVFENSDNNWVIGNSSIFYSKGRIDAVVPPPDNYISDYGDGSATVPDIIEIDPDDVLDTDDKLNYNSIKFSDFTLGGIFEYDENGRYIVAGLVEDSDTPLPSISGDALLAKYDEPPLSVVFRAEGIDALADSKMVGKIFVLDKSNNSHQVLYSCPDGLFASDTDGYSNADILVSESALGDASGRLTRIDPLGNILWSYGAGTFHIINDARVNSDDTLIVSV
jgi:hypothetical protein